MKNSAIFSSELILFILAFLQKFWQSICSNICYVLSIIDVEVITKELLGPTYLSEAQAFHIFEAAKVVVMHKNKDFVFVVF